jgi:hypothetical protein
VNYPRRLSVKNVLQSHQQRSVKFHFDNLTHWKIINEVDAVLIEKHQGENFSADFFTRNFWGGAE